MDKLIYYGSVVGENVKVYASTNDLDHSSLIIAKGSRISIYDEVITGNKVWVRHNNGWSIAANSDGEIFINLQPLVENPALEAAINGTAEEPQTQTTPATNTVNQTVVTTNEAKVYPSNKTMRLFGSPFQFNEYTDHRVSTISGFFGKKYAERVVAHAPYITIIPGDADYLGGETKTKKQEDSSIILSRLFSNEGDEVLSFGDSANQTSETRYYNFKQNYTGYMNRVNLTLRTMAIMVGLGDTALPVYDGTSVSTVALKEYNWADYRWDASHYTAGGTVNAASQGKDIGEAAAAAAALGSSVLARVGSSNIAFATIFRWMAGDSSGEEDLEDNKLSETWSTKNYVQFYIDPTATDATDSFSNQSNESKLKSIFESQQSTIKEMAFIAHTSGIDTSAFSDSASKAIDAAMDTFSGGDGGGLKGILGRVTQAAGNVINGENVIFPDVYQQSSVDTTSRSFRINLYSPYGTPLSIYLNILVPIGFLLCLTAPANKSANSYEAPPLVKVFYDGVYSCSLGIVESLRISRDSADWTADGLPTSAVVDLNIKDLYSSISVNSAGEDTELFMHNSSLVEFLLTQCGLSMISYNYQLKAEMRWNTTLNMSTDRFNTTAGIISESILNNIVNKFRNVI